MRLRDSVVMLYLTFFILTLAHPQVKGGADSVPSRKMPPHAEIPARLGYLGIPSPHIQAGRHGSSPAGRFRNRTQKSPFSIVPPRIDLSVASGESVGVAWARHFSSDLVPSSDYPNAIAADSNGNVYVTAVSQRTYSDGDFLTMKYDRRGDLRWEARSSGPDNGYSEPFAVAVDRGHNVYVTGYTVDPTRGTDILTVKYDSSGNTIWTNTYQGTGDSNDVAIAVGVDTSGNCYILGYCYDTGTDDDIVLISYSPGGGERWVRLFDGPSHGADKPTGLFVNPGGTVCYTGMTEGSGTGLDIITLQYDQEGAEQWRAFYSTAGTDYSTGIIADDSGNVDIAGFTGTSDPTMSYLVLQYSSGGVLHWTSVYNGVNSGPKKTTGIARDNNGNIIVTGVVTSGGSANYLTVKYDHATGSIVWEQLYDNPYHGDDYAIGTAVSTEGHIYVTGYSRFDSTTAFSYLTIEYDSTGKEILTDRFVPNGSDAVPTGIVNDNNTNIFICGPVIANSFDIEVLKYSYYQQGQLAITVDLGNTDDRLGGMAVDPTGHIYLCGSNGQSIAVVKYDNKLNFIWKTILPDLINPSVVACKLDQNQNLVLAGYARSQKGDYDILTSVVSSSGAVSWIQTYNGPDSLDDKAVALAIDGNGGIIVTGTSYSPNTFNDIVTLRYTPDGYLLWASRYNFWYNHDDIPSGIAMDHEQNIYITGTTVRPNTSNDILLLKYDTNGVQQWAKYFNGPGDGADYGRAIAVDVNDIVYVTGKIYGGETSSNVVLLKYTTAGDLIWNAIYQGNETSDKEPMGLVLDPKGFPVIAGMAYHAASSFDFLTLKYDTSGVLAWRAEYDGPVHGSDYAVSLTTDIAGDIYVVGNSLGSGSGIDIATLKYDTYGALQWIQRYDGSSSLDDEAVGIVVDSSANVFVGGTSYDDQTGYDFAIIKYLFPPIESWPVRYDGPGTSGDMTGAVTADPDGNVYVTGQSESANLSISCSTFKCDDGGNQIWSDYYEGTANSLNIGRDIDMMGNGNLVITGYDQEIGAPSFNYLTMQYTPEGMIDWTKTFSATGSSYNFATHLAVSGLQSVYVSGYTYNEGTGFDFSTVKYSPAGIQQWSAQYNDAYDDNDLMTALVVDRSENVYVTGLSGNGRRSTDFATVKYSPTGTQRWAAIYDGPSHLDDRPVAIAADSDGNIYVTGWTLSATTEHDIVTVKYDTAGVQKWVALYNGPANNRDEPVSVAVGQNGDIYVAGTSYNAYFTYPEFILIKYTPDGQQEWVQRYSGAPSSDNLLKKMVLDRAGKIYMTGVSTDSNGISDAITLKYDTSGNILWTARMSESHNASIVPADLVIDSDTGVIVAGTTSGQTWSVFTLVKYQQRISDDVKRESEAPLAYSLYQNYPNPFNSTTILTYSLAARSHVRLNVYNTLGQRVASLVDANQGPGTFHISYDASRLPSGIFFYKLDAANPFPGRGGHTGFTDVKKMTLMK